MKSKNIYLFLILLYFFSTQTIQAQCDGIEIPITTSLIPNTSFDGRTCCPNSVTPPNEQMDCIEDHIQASAATIDYHVVNCGESLDHPCLPYVPSGTPTGNGILGIVNEAGYKEYLGTCLTGTLIPNTQYILKFKFGFGMPKGQCTIGNPPVTYDIISFSPVTFSIYGTNDCSSLPFSGSGCPTPNWTLLGSISLSGYDEWKEESITFSVPQTMNAIVFGPDCLSNPPLGETGYYYLDEMLLNEINNPLPDLAISGHPCSGLTLEGENNSLLTYQWYYNNSPIVGAISNIYQIPVGQEGIYFLRMYYQNQCLDSNEFEYQVPSYEANVNEELCYGDSIQIGNTTFNTNGLYEVLLITSNGCDSMINLTLTIREELIASSFLEQEILCAGETTEVQATSNAQSPYYTWNDGTIAMSRILSSDVYSLYVTDEFGCSSDVYEFELAEPDSVKSYFVVTNETCVGYNDGTATVFIQGGTPPYQYSFEMEQFYPHIDSTEFTSLPPSEYFIEIIDSNKCLLTSGFEIFPREEVEVYIESLDAIPIGDSAFLCVKTNPTIDISTFEWFGNQLSCDTCSKPVIHPLRPPFNQYFVKMTEALVSCPYEAGIKVSIIDGVYIPNVFSPDLDGMNDIFYVQSFPGSVIEVKEFHVYDRWGEAMFSDYSFLPNSINNGWDGTFRGKQMPNGVYVYLSKILLQNNDVVVKKGTITLLR